MRIIGNDPSVPRQTQEVASGTLPNGKAVIVNADGTVSVVSETPVTQAVGTPVQFDSSTTSYSSVAYDSVNNKIVVVYRDHGSSNYGKAIVGTIDAANNSISFGSATTFNSAATNDTNIAFDSNAEKFVIVYRNNGNSQYGTAIVGTVSGTSISFGSAVVFNSGQTEQNGISFDSTSNKVVLAYTDAGNSNYGTAIVGTVSGTSISFGSETVYNSGYTLYNDPAYDSTNDKTIIAYHNGGSSPYPPSAIVGTVSGTSISFGSATAIQAVNGNYTSAVYDSTSEKIVVSYRNENNSNYGTAAVGTVSGTSITFGTPVVFNSAGLYHPRAVYDSTNNKTVIGYSDVGNSNYGYAIVGTVSGTSISFGTKVAFENNGIDNNPWLGGTFDSTNGKVIFSYRLSTSKAGKAVVFQNAGTETNVTSENYIGISRSGAASGAGAIIDTQGAIADIPAINYNLDLASFNDKSFNTQTNHNDIFIKPDGTKIYYIVDGGSAFQRTLSTAFDISTAGSATSFDGTSQDNDPRGITFKPDGTKMYLLGTQNNKVYQYSLSSAFDVTSASYDSKSISAAVGYVYGSEFKSDGTKMYLTESSSGTYYITEYTLSTPWDVSTASYTSNSFNVSSQSNALTGIFLRSDGTQIFGASQNDRKILQYNFGTAFDVSTLSYSNTSFDTSTQVGGSSSIKAVAFNPDGDKMYVGGVFSTDTIYQYSTTSAFTPAQSYFVQNDGTLGTTAADPNVFAGTAVSATKLIVKG